MGVIKRFVVFHGADYYPMAGWGDFHGSYDTLEEAKQKAPKPERDMSWTQIVDLETGEYEEIEENEVGRRLGRIEERARRLGRIFDTC